MLIWDNKQIEVKCWFVIDDSFIINNLKKGIQDSGNLCPVYLLKKSLELSCRKIQNGHKVNLNWQFENVRDERKQTPIPRGSDDTRQNCQIILLSKALGKDFLKSRSMTINIWLVLLAPSLEMKSNAQTRKSPAQVGRASCFRLQATCWHRQTANHCYQ